VRTIRAADKKFHTEIAKITKIYWFCISIVRPQPLATMT
jgi:hypothetical protein